MITVVFYKKTEPNKEVLGGLSGRVVEEEDWIKLREIARYLQTYASGWIDDGTAVYTGSSIYYVYGYSEENDASYAFIKCYKRLSDRKKVISWLMKNFEIIKQNWKKEEIVPLM